MKAFPKQLSVTEGEIQCAYFLIFTAAESEVLQSPLSDITCSTTSPLGDVDVPPTTSLLGVVPTTSPLGVVPTTSPLGVVPTTSALSVVPPTTSQLRAPTTLEVVPSFCHCRTRCHSQKSCPCKKLKVLCTVQHVYELQNIFNSGRKCRLNTENA